MTRGRWFVCSVCGEAAFKNRNTVHRCCGKTMGTKPLKEPDEEFIAKHRT